MSTRPVNRHGRRPLLASSSSESDDESQAHDKSQKNAFPFFSERDLHAYVPGSFACSCGQYYEFFQDPGHFDSHGTAWYKPELRLSCCYQYVQEHIDKCNEISRVATRARIDAQEAARAEAAQMEANKILRKKEQADNIAAKQAVGAVKELMDAIAGCEDAEAVRSEAAKFPLLSSRAAVAVWRDLRKNKQPKA